MSLLLSHTLDDAVAVMRGESFLASPAGGFPLEGLGIWRLSGIEPAPGSQPLDSDAAWSSVVRAWWGLSLTWCLVVEGGRQEIRWGFGLHDAMTPAPSAIPAHLIGARLNRGGDFGRIASRLHELPFRAAMAGHSGVGADARLEGAVRNMAGREFVVLIAARALPRDAIREELQRLSQEEQFVRDEHLARPSLERDNHAGASRYLELIESAKERALAAMQEGAWQVRTLLATKTGEDLLQAQAMIHAAFCQDGGKPEPLRWQDPADPRGLTLLRGGELAALSRPPRKELPGFLLEAATSTGSTPPALGPSIFATAATSVATDRSVAIGRILDDAGEPGSWLEIATDDLCRHVLVGGMTGSGKTTSCEHLLLELWREHRIPWLVIEPGMNPSYRRLLNSEIGTDLDVWSIGEPRYRRMPLNPMAAPPGIGLAEHTAGLFTIFASTFELVAPMPEVLAAAIEQTYRKHGWDLAGRVPEGPAPRLTDLLEEIDSSARGLGYGPEITGNIRAGLLLRLGRLARGPLAPEFNSPGGLDMTALIARPTVIELSALPDAASQALVMGIVALQLRHHWRLAGPSGSLRHVTLIEEAHRLLRAVPESPTNAARNRAAEDLANMLAELRACGAGLVIVDQTPSALVPSAIANTGTKILHRLDHPADREVVGRAAGIPAEQVDILGRLSKGDAVLRSDRRPRPFRVRVPNPAITYGKLPLPPVPVRVSRNERPEAAPPSKASCPVCGNIHCAVAAAAKDPGRLIATLRDLHQTFLKGEDAVWDWAIDRVKGAAEAANSPTAPLCFLMSLGQAAKLSPIILQRLQKTFEPRTRGANR